jgi:glutathione S-transferase
LGLPYEIKFYRRDEMTRLAPPELEAIHPLGKAPVVVDEGLTLIESGAIIESLIRRHGGGRLQPAGEGADREAYLQWLHYAEGSAMLPLMLRLYVSRLGEAGAPLHPRIESELTRHLGFVDRSLEGKEWLIGNELTGADLQMSYVGEAARARGNGERYLNIVGWVKRFQARPAYRRALERGGPYAFAS